MKTYNELVDELVPIIEQLAADYTHGKPATADFVNAALQVIRADRMIFLQDADRERLVDEVFWWDAEQSPDTRELAGHILMEIWHARDQKAEMRELFRPQAVQASSVADFLGRYYKPDRYTGRTKATGWSDDYAAGLLASYEADFAKDGYVIISHHDSVTGQVVALLELTPPKEYAHAIR